MNIERYVCGQFETNTYILEKDNEVIIIDPATRIETLDKYLNNRKLIAVLLTHGHFDHIKGVQDLVDKYKIPVYLNPLDKELVKDSKQATCFGIMKVDTIKSETIDLKEGLNKIGSFEVEVLFTPGHTQGSSIFIIGDDMFSGDTIFKLSVGRVDLPGGNNTELRNSLRLIKGLDKNYQVFPGHGDFTELEFEINNSYYFRTI